MAATTSVSAATWTGAVSRAGGVAHSTAARAPPAAPTVAVTFAAPEIRVCARSSSERPGCWARNVSASRTGIRGATSSIRSTSQLPPSTEARPALRAEATSAVDSRPRSLARSRREASSSPVRPVTRATRSPTPPLSLGGRGCALIPRACPAAVRLGRALLADQLSLDLLGQLTAVVHQEAAGTGELVCLARKDPHRQLLVGQVCAGQLE